MSQQMLQSRKISRMILHQPNPLNSVPTIEIQYKHFSLHMMLLIENIRSTTVIAGKGKSMWSILFGHEYICIASHCWPIKQYWYTYIWYSTQECRQNVLWKNVHGTVHCLKLFEKSSDRALMKLFLILLTRTEWFDSTNRFNFTWTTLIRESYTSSNYSLIVLIKL